MSTRTTQKWIVTGRVATPVELRTTGRGKSVCNFKLACDRTFAGPAGTQTITDHFPITIWGREAELQADHLEEGSVIYLEGYWKNYSWTDDHGHPHQSMECIPEKIVWLTKPKQSEQPYVAEVCQEVR